MRMSGPCVILTRREHKCDSLTFLQLSRFFHNEYANEETVCREMSTTFPFGTVSALTSLVRLSTLLHSKGRARSKADGVLSSLEFSVVSFSLHVSC